MAFSDAAAVFIVIPVDDVMAAVLNAPVFTIVPKHLRGAGEVRRFTGNPIGDILALLAAFFMGRDTFHHEGLPEMGEVQIVVEGRGDPDISGFDAAMLGAVEGAVIGFALEVVKIESGLFEQLF